MHPSKPTLRAYHDLALPELTADDVRRHVDSCADCRREIARFAGDANFVGQRLDMLDSGSTMPVHIARARLQSRLAQNQRENSMNRKIRRAAVPALIAAFLIVLFAVPSFRAAAVEFLGLFRVEQIEVVRFNPANLPTNMKGRMMDFDRLLADQFTFTGGGEPVEVTSAAEASALAGFDVLLPPGAENHTLTFQPAGQVSITVVLEIWQALLDELGRGDLVLPAELDGDTITISIPNSVTFVNGDCAIPRAPDGDFMPMHQVDCTVLVQMPNPTVEAPPGLPMSELGQIFLQFFGMSPQEAARFSAQVDWTTTLVIPVPNSADYRDVTVNEADGVLFEDYYDSGTANLGLVWVDGEMVYSLMLNGDHTAAEALALAQGLR